MMTSMLWWVEKMTTILFSCCEELSLFGRQRRGRLWTQGGQGPSLRRVLIFVLAVFLGDARVRAHTDGLNLFVSIGSPCLQRLARRLWWDQA